MASVATVTGSLMDSGPRHIIPVRVCMDTMLRLAENPDQHVMMREKMRFCANKFDILLGVDRAARDEGDGYHCKHSAYPNVIATLGDIPSTLKVVIMMAHQPRTYVQTFVKKTILDEDDKRKIVAYYDTLPSFTFMGISLGVGYAHPSSGDCVVSALVGGMITIRNGHFPVHTGDLIMWYFDFESSMFDKQGNRSNEPKEPELDKKSEDRKRTHDKENGVFGGPDDTDMHTGKKNVVYPKPFTVFSEQYKDNPALYIYDQKRVFAKAMGNARPFDKVDLLICNQSI